MSVTTEKEDGDDRCSLGVGGNCFSFVPGAKMRNEAYDFLIYELYLPTKDNVKTDLGNIAWDISVPGDSESLDVKLKLSCDSAGEYFVDATYGQPSDAGFLDVSTVGDQVNGYTSKPTLSISSHEATVEYTGRYDATDPSTGDAKSYWALVPIKTKASGDNGALNCDAVWTATDDVGYSYKMLEVTSEEDNGPYHYASDDDKYRDNYYSGSRSNTDDKYYLNYNLEEADLTWKNGENSDFSVKMLV